MLWAIFVILLLDTVSTCVAVWFAYTASWNSRWLQEVLEPLLAHIESIIDPNYPGPPTPPPIRG